VSNKLVDLNADVGERPGAEGVAADAEIVAAVTSANVACGFHAGDAETMRAVCDIAVLKRKRIGAHVSFLDREGFGRRESDVEPEVLREQVVQQIKALQIIARAAGGAVGYVKPHGALYNQAESDQALALALIEAIRAFDPRLRVVGRAGSAMQRAAEALDQAFTREAFADRRYASDGSLMPRTEPGAVIADPEQVAAQVRSLVTKSEVQTGDGSRVQIAFETLCVHGDTPGAPALAARVRQELQSLGVTVSAPRLLGVDTLPP
jgi:UPF0271 protein